MSYYITKTVPGLFTTLLGIFGIILARFEICAAL
jgi:hypothetical protein